MGVTHFPHGVFATPNIGGGRAFDFFNSENIFFVNGDGPTGGDGSSPDNPTNTVTVALTYAARGATIYVKPRDTAASAQTYYQEDIVIPLTLPNLKLLGCVPDGCTGAQSGPQFKPLTVAGHLIDVKAGNFTIENLRLTLTGGTAAAAKCIIHAVTVAGGLTTKPSGLVVRGCRFENDKSNPSYSGTEAVASIGLGTANDVTIEGNYFHNCIGGIAIQETSGIPHNIQIRGNTFTGAPAVRDCDILASWGDGTGLLIIGNYFADGLPALSAGATKRFVKIVGAGTGLMANNYFAARATNSSDLFDDDGTLCIIPDTFFQAHNYFFATTANYGLGDGTT